MGSRNTKQVPSTGRSIVPSFFKILFFSLSLIFGLMPRRDPALLTFTKPFSCILAFSESLSGRSPHRIEEILHRCLHLLRRSQFLSCVPLINSHDRSVTTSAFKTKILPSSAFVIIKRYGLSRTDSHAQTAAKTF